MKSVINESFANPDERLKFLIEECERFVDIMRNGVPVKELIKSLGEVVEYIRPITPQERTRLACEFRMLCERIVEEVEYVAGAEDSTEQVEAMLADPNLDEHVKAAIKATYQRGPKEAQ